jgi:hypothetical protein
MITAAQFNQADPAIRAFYKGFRDLFLWMYRPGYDEVNYGEVEIVPCNLMNRVLQTQANYGMTQNINAPLIWENDPWDNPVDSIPYDPAHGFGYYNQWENLAFYGDTPPREKLKVRKSYWTGVSRRRRNL